MRQDLADSILEKERRENRLAAPELAHNVKHVGTAGSGPFFEARMLKDPIQGSVLKDPVKSSRTSLFHIP
jgi:hypothetical protein